MKSKRNVTLYKMIEGQPDQLIGVAELTFKIVASGGELNLHKIRILGLRLPTSDTDYDFWREVFESGKGTKIKKMPKKIRNKLRYA